MPLRPPARSRPRTAGWISRPICGPPPAQHASSRTDRVLRWAPGRCRKAPSALPASLRRAQLAAPNPRPIVLLDRVGDFARLTVVLGVVAAHFALQLRKFADHAGQQVRLRKPGGALGEHDVGAEATRDLARH